MSCRLPHGYRRPRHRWVSERAKGDADKGRAPFRVPEHRGAAVGAEVNFDLSPRIAAAHIDLARPLGVYLLFREIGADAKGRAGTPLALRAMTRGHKRRLAGRLRAQRAAAAMRYPRHRQTPIFSLLPVDRALVSVSVSSKCAERHSDGAAQVAKHHEFLTEDLDSMGQVLQFVREANRLPIAV